MCEIFQHLSGCNDDAGDLIFFSMDYRRYDVVKELIDNKHPHFSKAYKTLHEEIKYFKFQKKQNCPLDTMERRERRTSTY